MNGIYRQRQPHVQAVQWNRPGDDERVMGVKIEFGLAGEQRVAEWLPAGQEADMYCLVGLQGPRKIEPGQWILTYEGGRTDIVADGFFQRHYEPITVIDVPETVLELTHG